MSRPRAERSTGSAKASLRKYLEIARISAANRLAYFGEALSRPLFFAVILFVFVQLWSAVYGADRRVVAGFTVGDVLWYLVLTEAILLSAPRLEGRVDEEVKSGGLATLLGRPCHYVLHHLAAFLGETLPLFALNLAAGLAVGTALIGPPPFSWMSLPVAAVSLTLAFTLHFYFSMGVALLAFWVEDATPFFWIYSKALFILGGLMIPLDFFPGWLRVLTDWLPFRHVLCEPARLAVHPSTTAVGGLLLWQVGWIVVVAAAVHGMFALGIRRVHLHGG